MKKYIKLLPVLWLPFLLLSCGTEEGNNSQNAWLKGAQNVTLEGARTRIKIPATFTKSSPYQLENDLPALKQNAFANSLTQATLKTLSGEYENIDVLIDSEAPLHYLMVVNSDRVDLDEDAGTLLDSQQREVFEKLKKRYKKLSVDRVSSNLKEGADRKALLYQYKLVDKATQYWTAYLITTELRTFRVFELNMAPDNLEKFLWTMNE